MARALHRSPPMGMRLVVQSALLALVIGGIAMVADALVVTDQERLEAFVDAVTGQESRRVDAALGYVDPARVPVEIMVGSESSTFGDGEEVDLAERARSALAPVEGRRVRLLQRAIEIDGDRALVALRLSGAEGVSNVQFRMARRGDGWLISRVRVL